MSASPEATRPSGRSAEGRLDYGAIGTVTNLAARLCGEASDGQFSHRAAGSSRRVESRIDAEPVGELTLKGFHRPFTRTTSWRPAPSHGLVRRLPSAPLRGWQRPRPSSTPRRVAGRLRSGLRTAAEAHAVDLHELGLKADIVGGSESGQQRTPARLFDHLVGGREQRRRHREAEHPGGLGVDDQLEFR